MSNIVYDGPIHQMIENPTEAQLKELVFDTDDEYWLAGSGDATITVESNLSRTHLGLKKVSPHGIRLLYKGSDGQLLVSVGHGKMEETIMVFSGGEYNEEMQVCFIELDAAYRGILEYCANGECPDSIEWVPWETMLL